VCVVFVVCLACVVCVVCCINRFSIEAEHVSFLCVFFRSSSGSASEDVYGMLGNRSGAILILEGVMGDIVDVFGLVARMWGGEGVSSKVESRLKVGFAVLHPPN